MLVNFLLILLTEILWLVGGMAFLRILQRLFPALLPEIKKVPIAFVAICGLIFSTFIAAIASLLIRINWEFQLFWAILLVLYAVLDHRWIISRLQRMEKLSFRRDFSLFLLLALIMALVIATSADVDRAYDDGLYHLQSVLLISRHRAIPGIGLLHNRLAYNSFWHISSAVWGYQFLHPKQLIFFVAAPVLMLNFMLFLLGTIRDEKNRWLQWTYLAILFGGIAYTVYYRYDFGAVDNNLPSFILVWLILIDFIRLNFSPAERSRPAQEYFLFLLLVAFSWSIKISTGMLIIPAAYMLYLLWKNKPIAATASLEIAFLLLVPWVARSVIASGYFLYPPPAAWMGLPVRWQMPFYMAHESAVVDMNWARVPGASTQAVSEMNIFQWLPLWAQSLDKLEILLLTVIVLAVALFAFSVFSKSGKLKISGMQTPAVIFLAWMAASVLFWFISYPAPRFLYGPAFPIVGSIFLAASFWLKDREKATSLPWMNGSILVCTLLIGLLFVRLNILSEIDYTDIKINPAPIPTVAIRQVPLNEFSINLPVSGNQCWATIVPCVPDKLSNAVHLIGQIVFDGLVFIDPDS